MSTSLAVCSTSWQGMWVCMQIIRKHGFFANDQSEFRLHPCHKWFWKCKVSEAHHLPVTSYQRQHLLSTSFRLLGRLFLRHSECNRIIITPKHWITVIPVMPAHSTLTWQVIVCVCVPFVCYLFVKSEKKHAEYAQRGVSGAEWLSWLRNLRNL